MSGRSPSKSWSTEACTLFHTWFGGFVCGSLATAAAVAVAVIYQLREDAKHLERYRDRGVNERNK